MCACVSAGLVAVIAWASYPSEWLVDDDRITIIYEVASEVRRVYLDGREAPDYFSAVADGVVERAMGKAMHW